MKPSYTDFDRVKCIASTENQKHRRKPIRIADIISYYASLFNEKYQHISIPVSTIHRVFNV